MYMESSRKVIHIDMDAFFASVEQRDDEELRGKPVVVGGSGKRSVVAASSYEARKFGVFSAMPMAMAKQRCKDLIIVPHRFDVYKKVSNQIRKIFHEYTDLVEPLSLDEAYMDVTQNFKSIPSATLIAKEIKRKVKSETALTCTAGVSVNKFLAKVASGLNKPDGLTTITPDEVDSFTRSLPVEQFFGVGKVTARKMKELGIDTGEDLRKFSLEDLGKIFGKSGKYFYKVCRGIDDRPVAPTRVRKSVSIERTFEENIYEEEEALAILAKLSNKLADTLDRMQLSGKTLSLKWRYPDFTTPTRSKSFASFSRDAQWIHLTLQKLMSEQVDFEKGIRLLGIGISNLDNEVDDSQLTLDL